MLKQLLFNSYNPGEQYDVGFKMHWFWKFKIKDDAHDVHFWALIHSLQFKGQDSQFLLNILPKYPAGHEFKQLPFNKNWFDEH